MNPDLRLADERFEVVSAAEAWHGAGAIDGAALAAIRLRYADDRKRTKAGFRVLFYLFTFWGGLALWGFFAAFVQVPFLSSSAAVPHAILLGFLAIGAAFGAGFAIERLKLRRFGIEEGLLTLALGWELGACGLLLDEFGMSPLWIGVGLCWNLAVAASLVAGRWGIAGSGALAGLGLFGAFALLPYPRLGILLASLPLIYIARWIDRQEIAAVAHRWRARELHVVALVALYAAVHVSAGPERLASEVATPEPGRTDAALASSVGLELGLDLWRALGWSAMFAIPLALLVSGFRRRDRLDLALGTIGLLASSTSAADALDLEPVWLVLAAAGAILMTVALAFRALFGQSPGRTRGGFTDTALYEPADGRSFLEIAGTLAAFSPAPRPAPDEPAFRGQGGEFGGGGASGQF